MAKRALGTVINKDEQKLGGLTSIGGIEITGETIDVTTLDSDGGYREFIGGFKDGGEVPIEGFFEPGEENGQVEMQDALDAGTADPYTIVFPTDPAYEWNFNGVVTAFNVGNAEVDGTIGFGATIKVSGKPVLSQVAAG